jgi:ABC-type Fe3+/spermidine/putrescine transport system ATPase subunit
VRTGAGTFTCAGDVEKGDVVICVRPEALHFDDAHPNRLSGVVRERVFLGNLFDYRIESPGGLRLRVQADPSRAFTPGAAISLSFDPAAAWAIRSGAN